MENLISTLKTRKENRGARWVIKGVNDSCIKAWKINRNHKEGFRYNRKKRSELESKRKVSKSGPNMVNRLREG